MTRNNNTKLRAVFLAALMFLWLFAGTVAFAGGAAAADATINDASVDATEYFQGQEVNITVSGTPGTGDTVQIREVTDRTDGNATTSTTQISEDVDNDDNVTVDTSNLDEGQYVLRYVTEDGSDSGFLGNDGVWQSGSLSDMDPSAAEFSIVVQSLSVEFDEDDDREVRAGESIELQYDSPARPSGYDVNVTEANEDIDAEELNATLYDLVEEGVVNDIQWDGYSDDEVILLEGVSSSFDEDVTFSEDIDDGDYELEFEAVDTTAEDTAEISVLEAEDEDGSFDAGLYTETRGDVVEISGQVEGTTDDELNLTIGDEEDFGYEANVTVEVNDDNEFTVLFNTRNAGLIGTTDNFPQDIDEMTGNVFGTAEDQGEVLFAEQSTDGNHLDAALVADTYDLELHDTDTDPSDFGDYDVSSMDLTERSTDSMTVWRADQSIAPGDDEVTDVDAIVNSTEDGTLTQTETVSIGDSGDNRAGTADLLVHEIGVSGIQGEGTSAADLLNKTANNGTLSLEYEQVDAAANADPLELNYTASDVSGNFDVVMDRENDRIFAVVNADDLRVSRGDSESPDSQGSAEVLPVDEQFEVTYNVSAKYRVNFDRNAAIGDDGYEADDDGAERVSQNLDVEDREIEFETIDGDIIVPPTEDAEITGTTTIAPGTEIDIRARGTGDNAFLRTAEEVVVNEDGSFSGTASFADVEAGTEFDATVRQQNFEDNGEQSGVVEELEGPVFAVSDLDPEEAEVMQGDTVTVSATITNEGDESGTQSVALMIDGDEVDSQEVELDSGGDTTVEFSDVDTSDLSEGDL